MPESSDQHIPTTFQLDLPAENEAGSFADFASIWHTENVFVLDFAALRGPAVDQTDDVGETRRVLPARVVSRIRIPPQQVFELAKALTRELEAWEQQTGAKPPEAPFFPQS